MLELGERQGSNLNEAELPRLVEINDANPQYRDNNLPTANYTLAAFFPATIFNQLDPRQNPANFYFLCIGFLQIVPPITQTQGVPITWLPLFIIVALDTGLLFYEELGRHKADRATNASKVSILSRGDSASTLGSIRASLSQGRLGSAAAQIPREMSSIFTLTGRSMLRGSAAPSRASAAGGSWWWAPRSWIDVRVGDIVRVEGNLVRRPSHRTLGASLARPRARRVLTSQELFPADLLCLGSSGGPQCWVNTKPLDGETDVKLRLVPPSVVAAVGAERLGDAAALGAALAGRVRAETPNDKVNEFIAELQLLQEEGGGQERCLVSEDNMLLRGCQLRNADYAVGLVLATGLDTKVGFKLSSKVHCTGAACNGCGHVMLHAVVVRCAAVRCVPHPPCPGVHAEARLD
jgi:hypothetical protein